jgi:uncharacterized membrane protein YqhA
MPPIDFVKIIQENGNKVINTHKTQYRRHEAKTDKLKQKVDKSTIMVGGVNLPLPLTDSFQQAENQ